MQRIIISILISITLSCNSQEKRPIENIQQTKTAEKKLTGDEVVMELEKRDFFNLTDSSELETAKQELAESKDNLNYFSGTMRGETVEFTDNRFFWIDCEELFEVGGLKIYLEKVKPTFKKLGLELEYENEKSEQTQDSWNHTIEINGKEYTAFNGEFSEADWEIAYINFIEILNDQLELQNSNNRFYPINCGNGGQMVLLTREQFEFVQANYPHDNEHPEQLNKWRQKIGL